MIVAAFLTVNTNSGTDAGTLWIFLLAFGLALLFIPCDHDPPALVVQYSYLRYA